MRICVFEDAAALNLEPLSLTRPVFDLRCGAATLLERAARTFGAAETAVFVRPAYAERWRQHHPRHLVNPAAVPAGGETVLVNGRWLAPPTLPLFADGGEVGLCGDDVAYAVLPPGETLAGFADDPAAVVDRLRPALPSRPAGGTMIRHPWDLVEQNPAALASDYQFWKTNHPARRSLDGLTILGPPERLIADPSARIEPHALIDTTGGPVLIDRDVVVQAFTRLEGPCHVGAGSQLFAARLRSGSVGPHCRVGGEVECSILHGYTNKYHDGFLGHSYLGEWVNLGAGTQTSDLRTDYGAVTMPVNGRTVDTGLMKIGSFLGDHSRTSISVLLNTGTVVGPFCQLLAYGALLPRSVPAFCRFGNGRVVERTDFGSMVATATTVLGRRGQTWTEADSEFFFALYEQTSAGRAKVIRESEQRRLRRVV